MSDRFHPISMEQLTAWAFTELREKDSLFGVPRSAFFVPRETDRFKLSSIGTASFHQRSCPKASSGTGMSPNPSSSLTIDRTRSGPSSVGLHLTEVWTSCSVSR